MEGAAVRSEAFFDATSLSTDEEDGAMVLLEVDFALDGRDDDWCLSFSAEFLVDEAIPLEEDFECFCWASDATFEPL